MEKKIELTRGQLTKILHSATGNVKDFVMNEQEWINEQLSIHIVSDLCCASCGYQMKFDTNEDKWGCTKCGHTSQHYR